MEKEKMEKELKEIIHQLKKMNKSLDELKVQIISQRKKMKGFDSGIINIGSHGDYPNPETSDK